MGNQTRLLHSKVRARNNLAPLNHKNIFNKIKTKIPFDSKKNIYIQFHEYTLRIIMCAYVHIYTHTHAHMHTHTHRHTCAHTHTHTCTLTHTDTHAHAHMHTHRHTCTHTHKYKHTRTYHYHYQYSYNTYTLISCMTYIHYKYRKYIPIPHNSMCMVHTYTSYMYSVYIYMIYILYMYYTHSYYSNTTMYTTHAYIQLCLYVCLHVRGPTQPQDMNAYTLYTYVIHYNCISPHTHKYTYALHKMHIHSNLHVSYQTHFL